MPERATIFETVQIGKETTHGTGVAANRKLASIGINAAPALGSSRYRPRGRKLDTLVVPGKRSTEGDIDGRATYEELIYPLSSMFGPATITTPVGATNAREWLFAMASQGPDAYVSYSVELGSSIHAAKFVHGVFTGLGVDFNTDELTLSGNIIGHKWQDDIMMTTSPTELGLMPVDPNDVSIYVDELFADLGTTLMERIFSGSFSITGKYGPVWVVNAANDSWVTVVETAPDATLSLVFEADATGMGLLDVFEEGATRFVRVEAVGPEIESGQDYLMRFDFAAKCEQVSFDDQDGVFGATWQMRLVDDPDLTGIGVLLRNGVAAL